MQNDQVNEIIQGIGAMSELWMITFRQFKKYNMSDDEALQHTKAFMSIIVGSIIGGKSGDAT